MEISPKAPSFNVCNLEGRVTVVSCVPEKAFCPTVIKLLGNVILFKGVSAKAIPPMLDTDSGIVILAILVL